MLHPIPHHPLELVGVANEICRFIQNERKQLDFSVTDYVNVILNPSVEMMSAISRMKSLIEEETRSTITYDCKLPENKMFTLDLDERLYVLPPNAKRRVIKYGMRITKNVLE